MKKRRTGQGVIRSVLCGSLLLGAGLGRIASAAPQPPLFSVTGLQGWSVQTFMSSAPTQYRLVQDDGTQVLHASCNNSASGMIWKGTVDLLKTPILHWRWKIAGLYPGIDELDKAGDDFPARVYVVTGSRWLPWTIKSLSYVWSNGSGHGAQEQPYWPSPYTDQAFVYALRVGTAGVGQWQQESRNIRADFSRVFGADVKDIGAVAVMTDCDDSHSHNQAWYGDLHFAAH